MRRILLVVLVLSAGAGNGEERAPSPARDLNTIARKPAIREIPRARTFRFEPKGDLTPQELDQLEPYLRGKPLYDVDQQALGPAMRHLREVK